MALSPTDLFNDATTREVGGVGPDQVNLVVSDLIGVQQALSEAFPQINNLTDLHAHVIINQLNEEIASIENAAAPAGTLILGTDLGQFVGRAINDIHRDIIDIAQGDEDLQAVFNPTPLPDLNTPAAPFHDNATQEAFLTQFIQDSNHLGQAAVTIANNDFTGDIAGLVQQIQSFETNANAFDQSQGGLYSARFWNELRADGTAGTAANALIDGLQTHNAGEIAAAADQLATNAGDLGSNNLRADGGTYADIIAAAQATAVTPNDPGGAVDADDDDIAVAQAADAAVDADDDDIAVAQAADAAVDADDDDIAAAQATAVTPNVADGGAGGGGGHGHGSVVNHAHDVAAVPNGLHADAAPATAAPAAAQTAAPAAAGPAPAAIDHASADAAVGTDIQPHTEKFDAHFHHLWG
jgi:trimeric autotransporter adhesin